MKIFKIILLLIYSGKNWYQHINDDLESIDFKKDVVYRFINCLRFNWEHLMAEIAVKIIAIISTLTKAAREREGKTNKCTKRFYNIII